jgi:hypothetical protein
MEESDTEATQKVDDNEPTSLAPFYLHDFLCRPARERTIVSIPYISVFEGRVQIGDTVKVRLVDEHLPLIIVLPRRMKCERISLFKSIHIVSGALDHCLHGRQ